MVAGIVLGLASGSSLRRAVLLRLAAGSATVMTHGTELCRPADVRLYGTLTGVAGRPVERTWIPAREPRAPIVRRLVRAPASLAGTVRAGGGRAAMARGPVGAGLEGDG